MKIPIELEKEGSKDCPFECPFSDREHSMCKLFNETLEAKMEWGYRELNACYSCEKLYKNHGEKKEENK